jgi:AbiV family abortive infection protein
MDAGLHERKRPTSTEDGVPSPFSGTISIADATRATNLIQDNAARLVEDAKLLLEAERYPTAAMLATMALEESSRVYFPLELVLSDHERRLEECWRKFRRDRHDFPWAILRRDDGLMNDAELNGMLSFIRTLGRRTECIEPGVWIDPQNLISRDLAQEIVKTAELFCSHRVTPRSLEIWAEAARTLPRNATNQTALEKYRSMLESEGLVVEASIVADISGRYDAIRQRFAKLPKKRRQASSL